MIEAILFDMDGVLIESENYYIDGTFSWMKKYGFKGDKTVLHQLIGTTMKTTYHLVYEWLEGKISEEEIQEINDNYFKENPLWYPSVLKEEVKEVLQVLKDQGKKIALCSSSSKVSIAEMLKTCELETYFDVVVSGEEFKESKPNPEIYLYAAKVLGVGTEQCVVVEDSKVGIEAGCRANMRVLAVVDEQFDHDQSKATKRIHNLKEVLDWIELNS
ncbi:MAG: HAD family hydrolase [Anaerorhabdus sp.]